MNKLTKKYNIKIPKNVKIVFSEGKKMLTSVGPLGTKSIELKIQIQINQNKKIINVSPFYFHESYKRKKKEARALRNTTVVQIKRMLIESSKLVYQKLKIVGVGYRANFTENFHQKLLTFKLGYSHFIYIKTSKILKINCLTKTRLCIFGSSYQNVSQFSALIRDNRIPEPYKGKGVQYENEDIKIKEGKKI